MIKCPVCHNPISSESKKCPKCEFDELQQDFISEADAEYWYRSKVLPYRAKWLATLSKPSVANLGTDEHNGNGADKLAHKTTVQNKHEEIVPQKIETQKQKKHIKTGAIGFIIVALIIVAISLPSIIDNSKEAKKKTTIESRIQEVTASLEQKIESQVDDDIVISFSYKEFMGYDTSLMWSFKIKMTKLEEYRKSGSSDEQLLLEIMDNCRIIQKIVEDEDDTFDFNVEYDGVRISINNYDGSVSYGDLSSYETFYYEEYGGDRYLHSFDTEYVIEDNQ